MADELQALLDRINREGLEKADAKREELLEKATEKSRNLVQEAREKADAMIADAQRETELFRKKGEQSLRQAARDVMLSLREQLEKRVSQVAELASAEAVTPDVIASVVLELVRNREKSGGTVEKLEILLNESQKADLEKVLADRLTADLKKKSELSPVPEITGGFRLKFNDDDLLYDFSDAALAEALSGFLNAKLAEIVKAEFQE